MKSNEYLPTDYRKFIHTSRYARWLPDDGVMVDRVGPMVWFADDNNPPFQQELGIWMTPDKSIAWSVENPDGAPTHFAYFEH